ncbi:hypothetical protein BHE74_00039922 [Ensete ventricosum]|nr:hypothetical protein GW17_00012842 [Ensete ventricosum]RWW53574.1 hypothetical protein BHE74_00039922 [Ensete ventricosum]RZR83733.1 hypothetical protein BHM03_00010426 [Ensete ventricosum]
MRHSVALLSASILTAVKLKAFSATVYNAGRVHQEDVFCVRRFGISSKYIPVLVKNQSVAYHDAEHLRRLQQQSDSRRRAAVMEMMRQRAAEVAADAG